MFSKPFRVKSNTMMRNSDKRKLRSRLESTYGSPFAGVADELLPSKAEITAVAVVLHRGDITDVFCVNGSPMFFECQPEKVLLPTVYALWTCPGFLEAWLTWPAVVTKLQGGADLMLPGVLHSPKLPSGGLGEFVRHTPRSVATPENAASVGVGVTAINSSTVSEQLATGFGLRGKGLLMKHTVQDHLWLFGSKSQQPSIEHPILPTAAAEGNAEEDTLKVAAEFSEANGESSYDPSEAASADAASSGSCLAEGSSSCAAAAESEVQESLAAASLEDTPLAAEDEKSPVERMDELLEKCFLLAIALRVKKADLPILTSNFYRTHMQSCCGSDESLDIKHSSHKKLSRFLTAMSSKFGCFVVKETAKGVDSLVSVDWSHPVLRQTKAERAGELPSLDDDSSAATADTPTPGFNLFLSPSVDLMPVFSAYGHGKDALLTDNDVKQIVTRYVRDNELAHEADRSLVRLNDALSRALRTKGEPAPTVLRWDALMNGVKSKMLSRHQVCVLPHS